MKDNNPPVYGQLVDEETRCKHYYSESDIIAIKFRCCQKYYSCFQCHNEAEDHPIMVWKREDYEMCVIICGVCKYEMNIYEYMDAELCLYCGSKFNPSCSKHFHLYFEM